MGDAVPLHEKKPNSVTELIMDAEGNLRHPLAGAQSQATEPRRRPWAATAAATIVLLLVGCGAWIFQVATSTPTSLHSSLVWYRSAHDETVFGGQGNQAMTSVTTGGPGLVAVGSDASNNDLNAAVWTSPNGATWTRIPHNETTFGGQGNQTMTSVTTGGPGLVAVGFDASNNDLNAAVWTSPNGTTWTRIPHNESTFGGQGNQTMTSVTTGGPGFVAVGFEISVSDPAEAAWTSPDGITWNRFGTSISDWDAAVWTSPDAITWTRIPHNDTAFGGANDNVMLGVIDWDQGLVAVGASGSIHDRDAAVWTSPDGITWTRVPRTEVALAGEGNQQMRSVTRGGPGLVAVGEGGHLSAGVWTSPDGAIWSRVPGNESVLSGKGNQQMTSVTTGNSRLVAVGLETSLVDVRFGISISDQDAAVWATRDG